MTASRFVTPFSALRCFLRLLYGERYTFAQLIYFQHFYHYLIVELQHLIRVVNIFMRYL